LINIIGHLKAKLMTYLPLEYANELIPMFMMAINKAKWVKITCSSVSVQDSWWLVLVILMRVTLKHKGKSD
jgi:hypothetical protein